MIGLILSAGYGTRLRPLTYFKPKPMVRVGDRPVMAHIVDYLRHYGVRRIIANVHYKPKKIYEYFGNELLYFYEPELLGEKGTINALEPWLKNEHTVVINGDTITNMPLNEMFKMSKGFNIKYMDGDTYAGVKILTPNYFDGEDFFVDYLDADSWWIDMGTFKGLRALRKKYAEKSSNLS